MDLSETKVTLLDTQWCELQKFLVKRTSHETGYNYKDDQFFYNVTVYESKKRYSVKDFVRELKSEKTVYLSDF